MDDQAAPNQDCEVFEDALEFHPSCPLEEMTLKESLKDANRALHLYLNNYFQESEDLLRVWSDRSIYHAMSLAVHHFVQALMTSDPRDIEVAMSDVNSALNVCSPRRKKRTWLVDNSVAKLMRKTDYDLYTEEEAHAEVCYCELLMLKAALVFIHDDSILSYIKAGLHIHAAFLAFKECQDLLEYRNWTDLDSKSHFETGVLFISGASNLFFASLPSTVLRILKFVGISCSLEIAFQKLERGHQLRDYLRGPFCTFLLLTYCSILTYALGGGSADVAYCKSLIEPELKSHPQGAIYLFFFGRFEVLNGNFEKAIEWLLQSTSSQDRWRQLKNLCHWDLTFCHIFKGAYRKALSYFTILSNESHWAKAVTQYMCAVILMSCEDINSEDQDTIDEIMKRVPSLRSKLSGKSIPIEKFLLTRAQRYVEEQRLFLPMEEMIYTFNYFPMVKKNMEVLQKLYTRIEAAVKELSQTNADGNRHYVEDYFLGTFLKGVCLRHMNKPSMAEECLNEVCNNEKNLKEGIHLPVWALIELGFMHNDLSDYEKAIECFELARSVSWNGRRKMAMRNRNQYKIHMGITAAKKELGKH